MKTSSSEAFLELSEAVKALNFGCFTLKSGRQSPYIFNSSAFSSGAALARVGDFLADLIAAHIPCDAIFGPAYKGISLATAASVALSARHGRDLPVFFDRKEAKTHGEGGRLLGSTEILKTPGARVVIVDDVISAGTAVLQAVETLKEAAPTAEVVGVVVLLDRQERASEMEAISAADKLEKEHGIRVWSVAKFDDLNEYTKKRCVSEKVQTEIAEYSRRYRV
jgi:orotate phosphoribosyltransferase